MHPACIVRSGNGLPVLLDTALGDIAQHMNKPTLNPKPEVLVLDSQPRVRDRLGEILSDIIQIRVADTPEKALEILSDQTISVVVTDQRWLKEGRDPPLESFSPVYPTPTKCFAPSTVVIFTLIWPSPGSPWNCASPSPKPLFTMSW